MRFSTGRWVGRCAEGVPKLSLWIPPEGPWPGASSREDRVLLVKQLDENH
jgi:hypothetical protein